MLSPETFTHGGAKEEAICDGSSYLEQRFHFILPALLSLSFIFCLFTCDVHKGDPHSKPESKLPQVRQKFMGMHILPSSSSYMESWCLDQCVRWLIFLYKKLMFRIGSFNWLHRFACRTCFEVSCGIRSTCAMLCPHLFLYDGEVLHAIKSSSNLYTSFTSKSFCNDKTFCGRWTVGGPWMLGWVRYRDIPRAMLFGLLFSVCKSYEHEMMKYIFHAA